MQLQPSVGIRMRCSCLCLKELLAKNHSGTNLVEIPSVVIVIFLFLCFVLFVHLGMPKLPKNRNSFMQGSFWHKVGLTPFTGSWDIVSLVFLLFLVTVSAGHLDSQFTHIFITFINGPFWPNLTGIHSCVLKIFAVKENQTCKRYVGHFDLIFLCIFVSLMPHWCSMQVFSHKYQAIPERKLILLFLLFLVATEN